MARMAAFWSLAFLILFGCNFLYGLLRGIGGLKAPIGGFVIPVLGVELSGAFLISSILAIGALVLLYRWSQRPNVADLLIDTEAELKKVTWPSFQDVVNSSLVVVICVLVLMGFMALSDAMLARIFNRILIGG
jgi:preprotein translocase SecE subunit